MEKLLASITVDLYEDGLTVWTQKKEKLTKEQEYQFQELLRRARELSERSTRQLVVDG